MSALTNLVSRFTRGRGTTPVTRTTGRRVAGTRPTGGRTTPGSATGSSVEGVARKLLRKAR